MEKRITLNVKKLREAAGKSQLQLATEVGVSQPAVANWERGVFLPRAEDLPAIAKALQCNIDDLYPEEVRP